MTPEEFEHYVGSFYISEGYEVKVSPLSNDWGIDVIATKGKEKLGIQVKMYGHTSRKVNRAMIMELYGAAAYQDCSRGVLVTDGIVLPDAIKVADKLGVEIRYLYPSLNYNQEIKINKKTEELPEEDSKAKGDYLSFGEVWEKYIKPLQGKTIENDGLINTIIKVNNAGIVRKTSNGKEGKIPIEGFRLAYNALIEKKFVSRDEINQNYAKRCSSGVVLVLSQVPFIEATTDPKGLKLILKKNS